MPNPISLQGTLPRNDSFVLRNTLFGEFPGFNYILYFSARAPARDRETVVSQTVKNGKTVVVRKHGNDEITLTWLPGRLIMTN